MTRSVKSSNPHACLPSESIGINDPAGAVGQVNPVFRQTVH
jgi:hypothetical protein